MSLLVVHHDPAVGLDLLAEPLAARDLDLVEVDATAAALPDPGDHDGVLVLGGRMSVAGDLEPWMDAELDVLRAADDAEVPVLGICLGSQLLALAHGGEVRPRERAEAAIVAVHRTAIGREDDVTAGWPDGAPGVAFHSDEVTVLPDDGEQLLLGSDGPTMWRIRTSHGIQLHPEVGLSTLASWVDTSGVDLAHVDVDALLDTARTSEPFMRAAGVSLVLRWVDGL